MPHGDWTLKRGAQLAGSVGVEGLSVPKPQRAHLQRPPTSGRPTAASLLEGDWLREEAILRCHIVPGRWQRWWELNRRRWPALIYQVDPLLCPQCGGTMRIIAFIDAHQARSHPQDPRTPRTLARPAAPCTAPSRDCHAGPPLTGEAPTLLLAAKRPSHVKGRFGQAPLRTRESPTRSIPIPWNTSIARHSTSSNCPGSYEPNRNMINLGLATARIRRYTAPMLPVGGPRTPGVPGRLRETGQRRLTVGGNRRNGGPT